MNILLTILLMLFGFFAGAAFTAFFMTEKATIDGNTRYILMDGRYDK